MTVTPVDFRNKLAQHLGYAYRVGPSRCTGQYGYHDCSGYMCWGMNSLGLTNNLCTSSFAISQWCYDLGLRIGEDEARHTDGVFAVRGDDFGRQDNGSRPNGASGHIVACYLPSMGGTYEAMGRRYGVVNGSFENRGWSAFYKIPGMHYGPPPPPPPPPAPTWKVPVIFLTHPDKGTWIVLEGPGGQVSFLSPTGAIVPVGMDQDPADKAAFGNRQIRELVKRTRNDGKPGFSIVATDGAKYVPKSQI